ncbi:MAG: acyl-CoA reductase [Candidatus Omnitrophota bacterium]
MRAPRKPIFLSTRASSPRKIFLGGENFAMPREAFEPSRPIKSIIGFLGRLSSLWLRKHYPYRKKAVSRLVSRSGYTPRMAEALLDGLFRELTEKKLLELLKAELGDPRVLDEFRPVRPGKRRLHARGPELILHIFAGNVPNPAILSFIFGMLLKSRNIGKVSSEDPGFLDIYLASLKKINPKLAGTNLLIDPKNKTAVKSWMKQADLVVAYGSDETLKALKSHAPPGTPFVSYGHRLSLALYTREVLKRKIAVSLAHKTALDVWMMDQRGCLSPVFLYVEKGGEVSPAEFSILVSKELDRIAWIDKNGEASPRRAALRMARENLRKIKQISFVRSFHSLKEAYKAIGCFKGHLQAVALEAGPGRRQKIAEELSRLGANRICHAGRMQFPPLAWNHDGHPNLASWVTWTDLEL